MGEEAQGLRDAPKFRGNELEGRKRMSTALQNPRKGAVKGRGEAQYCTQWDWTNVEP